MRKGKLFYLIILNLICMMIEKNWAQMPQPGLSQMPPAAQTPQQTIIQDLGKGMPERWTPEVAKEISGNIEDRPNLKPRAKIKSHEMHSFARARPPIRPQAPKQPAVPPCAEQMPNMNPLCAYACAGQYTTSMCHRMRMPEYMCEELKVDCLKECIIDQEDWLVEEG